MTAPDDSSGALADQAIDWIVLIHSGRAGHEDWVRLAQWRALSADHEAAYQAARALWGDAGEAARRAGPPAGDAFLAGAAGPPFPRQGRAAFRWAAARRAAGRRRAGRPAAALLGLALAALFGLHPLSDPLLHDYYTRHGEQKQVVLADGSRVLLDTDTALDADFDGRARRLRLAHGQALFEVRPDPARPFEVEAGPLAVRALGTVFGVRRDGRAAQVVVQEHAVAVRSPAARFAGEVRVAEGEKLDYGGGAAAPRPAPVDVWEAAAWQRRKLVFDGLPLAEVVDELNRYAGAKILILDGGLRARRVSGVFPLDDPDGALAAIASALQLGRTRLGPWLVLLHR